MACFYSHIRFIRGCKNGIYQYRRSIIGTNFYLQRVTRPQEREILRKFKAALPRIHIGKSSVGWTFSFHAVDKYELQDLDIDVVSKIESYGDLVAVLDTGKYDIFDEYEREVTNYEFFSLIENKRKCKFNHTTECLNNPRDRDYALANCWLDKAGNSFSRGEFS
jgi:hypothetical protein